MSQTECLVPANPQWQEFSAGKQPEFHKHRLEVWERCKAKREAEQQALPEDPIKITL
eukprot:CAMPEP_0196744882 /NCGR_PEP_ID=MMETSP1091-20130531/59304_1 /TAXON_ID=302021 /ORGANISM="Rhodomonas sp., Strain CCMP768" /LENGTH=56 /DNA_ID=CAMNT_0042091531 /DNA_START=9 /DNA_END=175 /DNA_ORIENTATION=+